MDWQLNSCIHSEIVSRDLVQNILINNNNNSLNGATIIRVLYGSTVRQVYIWWSDVTYLWSQCDRNFVGQHVVLCVVKWWRSVELFESNWISWFQKMSVLSLSYWESDVYWRQNNEHFAELAPQNGGKQLIWRNYVIVTLCIHPIIHPYTEGKTKSVPLWSLYQIMMRQMWQGHSAVTGSVQVSK